MLYTTEISSIINQSALLKPDRLWLKMTVSTSVQDDLSLDTTFFYNQLHHAVVIPEPLSVIHSTQLPHYAAVKDAIHRKLNTPDISLTTSLLGIGLRERHYVTFHQDRYGNQSIFDSKFSEPRRFLNTDILQRNYPRKISDYLAIFVNFITYSFGFGKVKRSQYLGSPITFYRLGTQGVWDGVSCGYHTAGAILSISEHIHQTGDSSIPSIKSRLEFVKGLDITAENILDAHQQTALNPQVIPDEINSSMVNVLHALSNLGPVLPQNDVQEEPIRFIHQDDLSNATVDAPCKAWAAI